MGCFKGLSSVFKALRLKKCHSSCCDIEIEGVPTREHSSVSSTPPDTPKQGESGKESKPVSTFMQV